MSTSDNEDAFRLLVQVVTGQRTTDTEISAKAKQIAFEMSKKNKVFLSFYEKSLGLSIDLPSDAHSLASQIYMRREAQKEAIRETKAVADSLAEEFMVIKTFKPFAYIGDDIDILMRDKKDVGVLARALRARGYFVRKVGTPEITLRKFINEIPVDLDVHDKLAAGPVQYVSVSEVWRNGVKLRIGDMELLAPTQEYELLITVAHSVLKESRMSLADMCHYLIVSGNFPQGFLDKAASRNGLTISLRVFAYVVNHFLNNFGLGTSVDEDGGLIGPVRSRIVSSAYRLPYAYPPEALVYAHLDKFRHEVTGRGVRAIPDYFRIPSSRGIGLLLDYLAWITLRREPIPWE
jgi:hypothetical protein